MSLSSHNVSDVCRLIVDPPATGAWNMALDEALVEAVAADRTPTLRIYRWERPTLSLGYFQSYAERNAHAPSRDADVVRRLSGGGAILHDRELTYSFILPANHSWAVDTHLLYQIVHRAIITWLNSLMHGDAPWRLVIYEPGPRDGRSQDQPFLCFQRRAPGDVLAIGEAGEHKIVGSAQRRRHGSVLQHGSILWATSVAAPEVCGFTHLVGLAASLDEAAARLSTDLPSLLGLRCEEVAVTGELAKSAENKCQVRYQSAVWTQRR